MSKNAGRHAMIGRALAAFVWLAIAVGNVLADESSAAPSPSGAVLSPEVSGPGLSFARLSPRTSKQANEAAAMAMASKREAATTSSLSQAGKVLKQSSRVSGDTAPLGPASLDTLARALKYDPDLIFEYVHDNIAYLPLWGISKGPLGAIIDNQGTDFDQAALMLELLHRSPGFAGAAFRKGTITLSAEQVQTWLGIDTSNACAVAAYFVQGGIPIDSVAHTGLCPSNPSPLISISIGHVWVTGVIIDGVSYDFDPSFKRYKSKTIIDLRSALVYGTTSSYSISDYLNSAMSGATESTINGNSVQHLNYANISQNLSGFATNLAKWLRANKPNAGLDDVLGGRQVISLFSDSQIPKDSRGHVRVMMLPYAANVPGESIQSATVFSPLPIDGRDAYRPTLRIEAAGINKLYSSDQLAGHRLTISFTQDNRPLLSLDGDEVGRGDTLPGNSSLQVAFSIIHGAYNSPINDWRVPSSRCGSVRRLVESQS
jgi:hypothetical protein